MANNPVKFYKGSYDAYIEGLAENKYTDGIFFDTDNQSIYLNGKEYGGAIDFSEVASKEWVNETYGDAFHDVVQEITDDKGFVASFLSALDDSSNGSIEIPIATELQAGLLSKADKQKIDSFDSDKFVQKQEGKDLSTNDYTDADKDKLTNIEERAQVNKIEGIKLNGIIQTINDDKIVDLNIQDIVDDTINNTVASAYQYRGTVPTAADLPTTDLNNGDVYNIEQASSEYGAAGVNVAWNADENKWDSLGGIFSTATLEQQINTLDAGLKYLDGRIDDLEELDLSNRLTDIENSMETLNSDELTPGSIKYISTQVAKTVVNNTVVWETL